jgi:hypothetical protein
MYEADINHLKVALTNAQNHILKLEHDLDQEQRLHNEQITRLTQEFDSERHDMDN